MISQSSNKETLSLEIILILLTLAEFQLVRLAVYYSLNLLVSLSGLLQPRSDLANGLSIVITGIILIAVYRPSFNSFVVSFISTKPSTRWIEISTGVGLALLAAINFILNPDQIVPTLISCLVFPLFEEPIFRGWIWKRLSSILPTRLNGILCTVFTALLFAVLHLGYADVIAHHISNPANLGHFLWMKMLVALIIGLFTGLLRWKTGRITAPILFHSAWNLFGR